MHMFTRADQIATADASAPHVVLLGAGASIAAAPIDANGKHLPSMPELASIEPVSTLLADAGFGGGPPDFEAAYSKLRMSGEHDDVADQIDAEVRAYFADVALPRDVTIYDHLLLALRPKDLVATFNWDPLLSQAADRLRAAGISALPQVVYLHGNVELAACEAHDRRGKPSERCPDCGSDLQPVPLLYPVEEKDYEQNKFIADAWSALQSALGNAARVTVFGYSAPVSDRAAIELLREAWGTWEEREFEQFELIVRPGADHEKMRDRWDSFIHSHHYDVVDDYFDSMLARAPRRTVEVFIAQNLHAKFADENPVPRDRAFDETIAFYRELIAHEV